MYAVFLLTDLDSTESYPFSLHDALPISVCARRATRCALSRFFPFPFGWLHAMMQSCSPVPQKIRRKETAMKRWMILLLLVCLTRSEEHTSELQSRFDIVCRLLRDK